MASIMEPLRKLASKMGITEDAATISELINLMNEKIEADNGITISESLDNYAEAYTPSNEG